MVPTPAIRNLIRDDKVHQIYSTMQTGQEKLGMQTMNQNLVDALPEAADHARDGDERVVAEGRARADDQPRRRRRRRGGYEPAGMPPRATGRELSSGSKAAVSRSLKLSELRAEVRAEGRRHADFCLFGSDTRRARRSPASGSPTRWTPRSRRCGASRSWSRASIRPRRAAKARSQGSEAGRAEAGQGRAVQEPGDLHPAVLGHDRRRPAARPVSGHPRQAGAAQELLGGHPEGAGGRRGAAPRSPTA